MGGLFMKWLPLVLALAANGRGEMAKVGIFVDFEDKPSVAAVRAMREEMRLLLVPAGVEAAWRSLAENRGVERFSSVMIVKFKGTCRTDLPVFESDPPDPYAGHVRLAAARLAGRRVMPHAEVDCDSVKRGVARVHPRDRAAAFGKALGRVLAHELYHVALDTAEHGKAGLAKAVLGWDELTGAGGFAPIDLERLVDRFR
jgi:hypothetical protein